MTRFEIKINNTPNEEISAFLKSHGTVFHSHAFLSCIGEDYKCIVAIAKSSGEIAGVLPLVKSKKYGLKSYHIPSFAYQFGPVISDRFISSTNKILGCLLHPIKKEKQLDFKLIIENGNILPFIERNFTISPSQTHVIPKNFEYNLGALSKDKARDVKKLLQKKDEKYLKVEENNKSNLPYILSMWEQTSERASFSSHLKTLEQIFSSNIDYYSNVIFDNKGIPLAGAYCPYDSKRMYHLIGASIRSTESILNRSNILSLFLAIKHANHHKLEFDFEGSNVPGVAKFYQMMGGHPKLIYRIQKCRSAYYHFLRTLKTYREEQMWG